MRAVRGAEISLIFQEPMTALNPVFTIGDQIAETLIVHGRATRRAARRRPSSCSDAVRLPERRIARRATIPHQLSGGMRQRVMIAIALACTPSLVIADEPTTALDVTIQAEILDLLREMKTAYALSLLLITHDLGVVAEMADRVAVMYAGRIVEAGPVRAIFQRPGASLYTRTARIDPGRPAGRAAACDRRHGAALGALPPGCAFEPRCPGRFDRCVTAPPPDYPVGVDHHSRCYLCIAPAIENRSPASSASHG